MPSLMKTVLLLHKKVDRRRILSYKIVKRVMFSTFSVMPEDYLPMHSDIAKEKVKPEDAETRVSLDSSNSEVPTITLTYSFLSSMSGEFSTTSRTKTKTSWIVNMLKSGNGPMKESVVDYLELLSNQTVVDYILDEDANPTTVDIEMFELSREDIFSEVENLNYLVTAMIFLEDSEKERISITRIIRRVLDNAIVQPFGITILFCDLMFHIFILFGWRSVTFRLINVAVTEDKEQEPRRGQLLLESLFYISTLYFFWRLIGEVFSTLITSWQVFRVNFLTPWTIVDVASIIMSVICFGLLMSSTNGNNQLGIYSEEWFSFFAVLTGLLWIKLLSFLKVMNPALATFVLAIGQVLNDVALMLVILAVVTFAFGDMFYTIIKRDFTICPPDEDPNDSGNPYCQHGLSYLDMFTQILGQFGYGSFLGHPLLVTLFILMTIFGAVIFLNILIAVVSDSYGKSCDNAARLFGRARILAVAKINALEGIMQPKLLNRGDVPTVRVGKLLFKLLSLAGCAFTLYELTVFFSYIRGEESITTAEVFADILLILFFCGVIILFFVLIIGWGENLRFPKLMVMVNNPIITWVYWKPMVFLVYLAMGRSSLVMSNEGPDEDHDGWSAKMKQIDSTVSELVEKSEDKLVRIITSLENRLKESEKQRAEEMEMFKKYVASQDPHFKDY
uniref:Ion transport domain-containing protein n=1 Tax=Ditylum brightwellii TaxID=49249 RepID=A0A7S2EEL3_9STRA|mmetsp:Transcript_26360/g.39167  ORF Transcript_26360/g.39167 Transcript_26360/m.39167 type:complete len:675 (+) Transcript_26360:315-2339(+)